MVYQATEAAEREKDPRTSSRDLAKVLLEVHPRYEEFRFRWKLYTTCYHGVNIREHLHKHLRESNESLDLRKKRAYYLNYCEPVIDLYVHYIFSKPIVRKPDKTSEYTVTIKPGYLASGPAPGSTLQPTDADRLEWENWLENVDRKGNDIDRFMAKAGRIALACGHSYVLVDMPRSEQEIVTEQQRRDAGLVPYLVLYYPQDMTNFELDENGELLWARFREAAPPETDPFKPRKRAKQTIKSVAEKQLDSLWEVHDSSAEELYFKTWTRDAWYLHKVTRDGAELVSSGSHPCGVVPVVPVYNTRFVDFEFFGRSLIAEIAPINIAIFNWSSLLDEEIYQKCLNILCIQRAPSQGAGEIIIGSNNTLEYEGSPPFFLSPATDPGSFIQSQIDRMRDEIFRLAKLGGGLGVEVRSQMSGVAHAYEFNETNRTIAEKADELERAENKIHKLWHAWLQREWIGSVDYPDSFSIESFESELDLILRARSAVESPTFLSELQKRAAKKILGNISQDLLQQITQEIDSTVRQRIIAEQQNVAGEDPQQGSSNSSTTGTPPGNMQ